MCDVHVQEEQNVDWLVNFVNNYEIPEETPGRKPRTEDEKQYAVSLCGATYHKVDPVKGGMKLLTFRCKDRARCTGCRKRYIDDAIHDLCDAKDYFGGMWEYAEPIHPDERDKVYQRLYRAMYRDRYMRIDVASDNMKLVIASDKKPSFSKMNNWKLFDPRGLSPEQEVEITIPHVDGTKSGALVNYRNKQKEKTAEPSFTIPEPLIFIHNHLSDLAKSIKAAFDEATIRTHELHLTANISPEHRKRAVMTRTNAVLEVLSEWGYGYTVIWQKQKVSMKSMSERFF